MRLGNRFTSTSMHALSTRWKRIQCELLADPPLVSLSPRRTTGQVDQGVHLQQPSSSSSVSVSKGARMSPLVTQSTVRSTTPAPLVKPVPTSAAHCGNSAWLFKDPSQAKGVSEPRAHSSVGEGWRDRRRNDS